MISHTEPDRGPQPPQASVVLWDLPTRLFHWSLALCTLIACASAQRGGDGALRLHFLSGYAILTLVGFRLLWGFAGAQYARFGQFVRGPAATLGYAVSLLRGRRGSYDSYPRHNPLGGLSVLALLAVCAALAASGLFARDDIASEGPLAAMVSEAMVGRFTRLHAWGELLLYALVALHLLAVAFYRFAKGEDLVGPMLTGRKAPRAPAGGPAAGASPAAAAHAGDDARTRARALLLFALCAALVAYLVQL